MLLVCLYVRIRFVYKRPFDGGYNETCDPAFNESNRSDALKKVLILLNKGEMGAWEDMAVKLRFPGFK